MRRKGETLWECMRRNGWEHVSGPLSESGFSTMKQDGVYAVWMKDGKTWTYGIRHHLDGSASLGSSTWIGPGDMDYEPYPICCEVQ